MRIYLSSKMTGEEDYGMKKFKEMEDFLVDKYNNPSIFNPYTYAIYYAERNDIPIYEIEREDILKHDIKFLLESDLIVVGKDTDSKGVEFELYLAKQLGIPVKYFESLKK